MTYGNCAACGVTGALDVSASNHPHPTKRLLHPQCRAELLDKKRNADHFDCPSCRMEFSPDEFPFRFTQIMGAMSNSVGWKVEQQTCPNCGVRLAACFEVCAFCRGAVSRATAARSVELSGVQYRHRACTAQSLNQIGGLGQRPAYRRQAAMIGIAKLPDGPVSVALSPNVRSALTVAPLSPGGSLGPIVIRLWTLAPGWKAGKKRLEEVAAVDAPGAVLGCRFGQRESSVLALTRSPRELTNRLTDFAIFRADGTETLKVAERFSVPCADFVASPDATRVLIEQRGGPAVADRWIVCDLLKPDKAVALDQPKRRLGGAKVRLNDRLVATGPRLELWDATTGHRINPPGPLPELETFAIGERGDLLAGGSGQWFWRGQVAIWKLPGFERVALHRHWGGELHDIAISTDSKLVAAALGTEIRLYGGERFANMTRLGSATRAGLFGYALQKIFFSTDGTRLVSIWKRSKPAPRTAVAVWALPNGRHCVVLNDPSVVELDVDRAGKRAIGICSDATLRLWNLDIG